MYWHFDIYLLAACQAAVQCAATGDYVLQHCKQTTIKLNIARIFLSIHKLVLWIFKKVFECVTVKVNMDLSCGENMQNSGNSGNGRPADMCIAGSDRALDRDPRILLNLQTLERLHAVHTDYFQNVQIDIQPFMRKVVTTWMLEVNSFETYLHFYFRTIYYIYLNPII